jgi:hypothetical protein
MEMTMFEKFGEFDTADELNAKAKELKDAGKEKELTELALENGLDKEDAEDYWDDCADTLVTTLQAAVGKLRMEEKALELSGVLSDWCEELIETCAADRVFAQAVRKKGKDLAGYIALTADTGYKNRCIVKQEIVNKTVEVKKVIKAHEFSIGIPDKRTRWELARKYYLGEEATV